ncbi:MAG: hypothetical protein ACO4AI_03760 [Prochlorothrix sp.]
MAYSDFSLETLLLTFGLTEESDRLFPAVTPAEPSDWLQETLRLGLDFGLKSGSEKARSEFVIAPILLELERWSQEQQRSPFVIHSGKVLTADASQGLTGECDFILSAGSYTRTIQNPIFALVEAKKQDLDLGLGQCGAQLLGARLWNQRKGHTLNSLFGCVTTGETWLWLQLDDDRLILDQDTYYIHNLPKILAIFQSLLP